MIDQPTFRIASSTVADRQNGLIVGPRVAVISGSAHSPRTATIDAPAHTSKKTEDFLRSAVDPLLAVATAVVAPLFVAAVAVAVVAITLSLSPAPDRPLSLAGPISGHSVLHFPR
jgi:hypothetical protein